MKRTSCLVNISYKMIPTAHQGTAGPRRPCPPTSSRYTGRVPNRSQVGVCQFFHPQICDHQITISAHQNIFRLHITVDDPIPVEEVRCADHICQIESGELWLRHRLVLVTWRVPEGINSSIRYKFFSLYPLALHSGGQWTLKALSLKFTRRTGFQVFVGRNAELQLQSKPWPSGTSGRRGHAIGPM
jgi:hypothetical protein